MVVGYSPTRAAMQAASPRNQDRLGLPKLQTGRKHSCAWYCHVRTSRFMQPAPQQIKGPAADPGYVSESAWRPHQRDATLLPALAIILNDLLTP